jgi:hypothetical protein
MAKPGDAFKGVEDLAIPPKRACLLFGVQVGVAPPDKALQTATIDQGGEELGLSASGSESVHTPMSGGSLSVFGSTSRSSEALLSTGAAGLRLPHP